MNVSRVARFGTYRLLFAEFASLAHQNIDIFVLPDATYGPHAASTGEPHPRLKGEQQMTALDLGEFLKLKGVTSAL
jgi:hypothetical protein